MRPAAGTSDRLDRFDRRFYGFALPGAAAWIVFQVIFPSVMPRIEQPGSFALGVLLFPVLVCFYTTCLVFIVFILWLPIPRRVKACVVLVNSSHLLFTTLFLAFG